MGRAIASITISAAAALPFSPALGAFWRKLTRQLFEGYRPERHYMRGPGPKWHAKHDA